MLKATGMVRKIDILGRIVLPIELRKTLGVEAWDSLEFFEDGMIMVLKKYAPGCVFCGAIDNIILRIYNKPVCKSCTQELGETQQGTSVISP